MALEWHEKQSSQWSAGHATRALRQLERDLFPLIGARRLAEIQPTELLATVRKIEKRGALETVDRGLMLCRQIWRYAIATGRAERDVTYGLKDALQPYRGTHFAAITLGVLLRAIHAYRGGPIARAALQLAPMLFQRPGELRAAAWSEIDLEQGIWTIPPARMKRERTGKNTGTPTLYPCPPRRLQSSRSSIASPGTGDSCSLVSEITSGRFRKTQSTALISLGYTSELQTWHGFRATARTMLAERLDVDPLLIEAQLAHAVKDANGRAYNRTKYLEQRVKMMRRWADYLDQLRAKEPKNNHPGTKRQAIRKADPTMREVFAQGAGRRRPQVEGAHVNGGPGAAESLNGSPATREQAGQPRKTMAEVFGRAALR